MTTPRAEPFLVKALTVAEHVFELFDIQAELYCTNFQIDLASTRS